MKKTPLAMLFAALALVAPAQLLQDFAPSAPSGIENGELRIENSGTSTGSAESQRPASKARPAAKSRGKSGIGSSELKLTGRYMSANRQTGELTASGGVSAVSGVYRFFGEDVRRDQLSLIDFGPNPMMTTCSNDTDHLHWRLSGKAPADWLPSGSFSYQDTGYTNLEGEVIHRALKLRNMWAYWYDIPVLWVPFWYYPFDTNYGWRFLPGYTSRWGGYILSGYVYNIINEGDPDKFGLGGSSYLDYRTKNGFALGQTIRWHLKDFGHGKIKAWRAWDEDYDRYENHWSDHKHNYRNWGSTVDRDRYRIYIEHKADFTERDALRLQAQYLSDSHVLYDFFRRGREHVSYPMNELWYDHRENSWAAGGSVGGPVNRFYGGTQRLPEGWLAIEPQPIWDLPVNYESQTRAGYLNRDSAHYGGAQGPFAHFPYIGYNGKGADYQAFRADTAHRITLPTKLWDVVSLVPRATYRCTWWSDSGDRDSGYTSASGDPFARHIFEIGATAAARYTGWLNDNWRHTFEPYIDYSFQKASLSENAKNRHYLFDSYDRSVDWRDQFGFEGRGLPYSWHGVRPGIRNLFQKRDDKGVSRSAIDTDFYLAVPFQDESYYSWDYRGADRVRRSLRGRAREDEYGNYNRTDCVVPGVFVRYTPYKNVFFSTRVEYDCEDDRFAYADVSFNHRLSDSFSWHASYLGRDHRIWDYLATDSQPLRNGSTDRWNWELDNAIYLGFTHHTCDWFAWSPFIRYEARRSQVDEVGVWFDFLTDCLGYRIEFSHEDGYRRIDGSKTESDDRVTFFIYLRAMGPGSALDLMKF